MGEKIPRVRAGIWGDANAAQGCSCRAGTLPGSDFAVELIPQQTTTLQVCNTSHKGHKTQKASKAEGATKQGASQPRKRALLWKSGEILLQEKGKEAGRRGRSLVGSGAVPVSPPWGRAVGLELLLEREEPLM